MAEKKKKPNNQAPSLNYEIKTSSYFFIAL